MALRYLLDTSALLAHSRQEPGWERVQALFEDDSCEILAASPSLTEFARRLHVLGATVEQARRGAEDYRDLLDEIILVDERVAFAAFEIGCAMDERLPLVDALIAAAAREQSACLVHRDHHMAAIPASVLEQVDLSKQPDS